LAFDSESILGQINLKKDQEKKIVAILDKYAGKYIAAYNKSFKAGNSCKAPSKSNKVFKNNSLKAFSTRSVTTYLLLSPRKGDFRKILDKEQYKAYYKGMALLQQFTKGGTYFLKTGKGQNVLTKRMEKIEEGLEKILKPFKTSETPA